MPRVEAVALNNGRIQKNQGTDSLNIGPIVFGSPATTIISGGAIAATRTYLSVDTEGGAATDDLDNINDGVAGDILILVCENAARFITLRDNVGNLRLAGNFVFASVNDTICLIYDGANWLELGRSVNGVI